MSSASDTATDGAGQSEAPAVVGSAIRYRWVLAALCVYAGATLVFLYIEPLLVRIFGPNPCCPTEGLGTTRIAALAWLGLCALTACVARCFLLRALLPMEGWGAAALGTLKGVWLFFVFGIMFFLAAYQMDRFGLVFLLTIVLLALVVAVLQAQSTQVTPPNSRSHGFWRHSLLAVENIYLFLLGLSGIFSLALACSTLGGLHDLRLACP